MAYSYEIISKIIIRIIKGEKVKQISEEFKISTSTIYNWKKKYYDQVNETLQASIEITKLISENKLMEALKICEDDKFKKDAVIQSQHITIFLKLYDLDNNIKWLNKALCICENKTFKERHPIQSQHINILLSLYKKEKDIKWLKKALCICENEEFKNNNKIQFHHITILLKLYGKDKNIEWLKKALKICENQIFQNYEPIQSQRIKILLILYKKGKNIKWLKKALSVCENEEFKSNNKIQFHHITILLKLYNIDKNIEWLNKALMICENQIFQNYQPIQSQHIRILLKFYDIDNNIEWLNKALCICEDDKFKDYAPIQSQHITILLKLYNIDNNIEWINQALIILNDKFFKKDASDIQSQRKQIEKILHNKETKHNTPSPKSVSNTSASNENHFSNAIKLINSSSSDDFTELENQILSSNNAEWQKVILIVALYEKHNYPLSVVTNYLKRQMAIYKDNAPVLQIIKKLSAHAKNQKKTFFDIKFYLNLLNQNIPISINVEKERTGLINLAENLSNNLNESGGARK